MLHSTEYVIPPGSLILVTGANGYIASHTIDILLHRGYKVRGTVRTAKPWLDSYFAERYGEGRYESIIIPLLDDPEMCRRAMQDVSGVLHIASDMSFNSDPDAVIPWVKRAAIHLLEAAASQSSVTRFVLTSSSTAALLPTPGLKTVVDETTWNQVSVHAAWDESTPPEKRAYHIYSAAKTEQERESWRWVRERKPRFEFNTVVPNSNFGRVLHPQVAGLSMIRMRNLLRGDGSVMDEFPPQWYVNVEDTARLHVVALLSPAVRGERIFAFASEFNWTDVVSILRRLRPDNALIPDPPANEGRDASEILPTRRAEDLLREFYGQPGWMSLEETIAAGIEDVP
ncbi:aldehyde reductase II [Aspergillus brunneoviolaceus CBS 621.78]|uniref:NAD(P)-binding protein n=1 Tax=Aspergillus brunneoviolaceus CBS 621.78 TaxID=1450534 RepID=A0ACD1GMJ7_9EURO|nr:NAD(P)-binding protein [Aspergillus brunneoviolaceus CBS 621.78]RAH50395.1 NAD(P)-binding protein [Aspergillus brunneoviolaceus CBS 621.78]